MNRKDTKDMEMKKVDIIIPVLNGAKWIQGCLDSALGQSHKPNRIIVVDDGSTDGSQDLVYKRKDILLVKNTSHGLASARNFGFKY